MKYKDLPCVCEVRYILQVLTRSLKCNLIAFVWYQELLYALRPYLYLIWSLGGKNQYWCSESHTTGILYDKYIVTSRRDKESHASFTTIAVSAGGKIFVPLDNCDVRACVSRVLFGLYQFLSGIDKLWAQHWRIFAGKEPEQHGIWTMYGVPRIYLHDRQNWRLAGLTLCFDVKSREITWGTRCSTNECCNNK